MISHIAADKKSKNTFLPRAAAAEPLASARRTAGRAPPAAAEPRRRAYQLPPGMADAC